jgi:hypothetical protein
MTKTVSLLLCCVLFTFSACTRQPRITQQELVQRTQELFDSVAAGDQAPWKKYFADDCMYFDETGKNKNKNALVADITPLPQGYSGSIAIVKVQSHIENNVAILSYEMDEKESVFGQQETARYHATDTWMRRNGEWQIVAGQVLRYYADPAPARVDPRTFKDYLGTYELAPGKTLDILQDRTQLYRQRAPGPKVELIPETAGMFFRKGVEGRILFRRGDDGKVDALIDRRNNEDVVWNKIAMLREH